MFYPELLDIIKKTGAREAIEKLDKYLAFLPNKSENIVTSSNIASYLQLDFDVVKLILNYIYKIGILERMYIIRCPECDREILVTNKENLLNNTRNLNLCIKCKNNIKITSEDVYIGYKVIKQPTLDQNEIIEETKKLLGDKVNDKSNESETLAKLFKDGDEHPHDFFYHPSKADMNILKKMLISLDGNYGRSTTAKGKALEGLVCKLFNLCKGMVATSKINTKTNQIDCTVRNDFFIHLTVYQELGSIVIAECKNEPSKTPGNTYYHKLYGIIEKSKSQNEQAVGILFSRKKIAKECKILAHDYFLKDNIIIINIYDEDLDRIINKNANFLDMLQEKIQTIKNNITTNPEKYKLYRK